MIGKANLKDEHNSNKMLKYKESHVSTEEKK